MATQNSMPQSATQIALLKALAEFIEEGTPHLDIHQAYKYFNETETVCVQAKTAIYRELERHDANMSVLLRQARLKMDRKRMEKGGDRDAAHLDAGPGVMESLTALEEMYGGYESAAWYEGYLMKLFHYWRKFEKEVRQLYEPVWEWVAEKPYSATD